MPEGTLNRRDLTLDDLGGLVRQIGIAFLATPQIYDSLAYSPADSCFVLDFGSPKGELVIRAGQRGIQDTHKSTTAPPKATAAWNDWLTIEVKLRTHGSLSSCYTGPQSSSNQPEGPDGLNEVAAEAVKNIQRLTGIDIGSALAHVRSGDLPEINGEKPASASASVGCAGDAPAVAI